jgi:hypothetical protein
LVLLPLTGRRTKGEEKDGKGRRTGKRIRESLRLFPYGKDIINI